MLKKTATVVNFGVHLLFRYKLVLVKADIFTWI